MYFGFTTGDSNVVAEIEFVSGRKYGRHGWVPSRISSNPLAMTTLRIWLRQMKKLLWLSLIVRDWLSDGIDWFVIWEVVCPVIIPDPTVGISPESCNGVTLVKWFAIVDCSDTIWEVESWMERNWKTG